MGGRVVSSLPPSITTSHALASCVASFTYSFVSSFFFVQCGNNSSKDNGTTTTNQLQYHHRF
jgi:hypothetical protein